MSTWNNISLLVHLSTAFDKNIYDHIHTWLVRERRRLSFYYLPFTTYYLPELGDPWRHIFRHTLRHILHHMLHHTLHHFDKGGIMGLKLDTIWRE